jgi:hypothetical protein
VAITYVEVDADNLSTWHKPLFDFVSTLDMTMRCNAAAVARGLTTLTYPSMAGIQEHVDLDDLIVVRQDGGVVLGYLICSADTKYGGCQAKWIGIPFMAPPQNMADAYAAMGDIAIAKYGWLWGRVTHPGMRNIMLTLVIGCDNSIEDQPDIVVYDPLGNKP